MRTKARTKKYFNPQRENNKCRCDFPGCTKAGEFRAPKDRSLKEYYWFCLEHVQAYNAKWNYYDSEEETDSSSAKNDSKPHLHFKSFRSKIKYQFGYDFTEELGYLGEFASPYSSSSIFFTQQEREYLKIMELSEEEISLSLIKKQYKKLVKKYHPDINRNDKSAEEKFKQLGIAYKALVEKFS
jgi:hypothetical protein